MPNARWRKWPKRKSLVDGYELYVGDEAVARIIDWSYGIEVDAYAPLAITGRSTVATVDEAKRVGVDLAIAEYERSAEILAALRKLKEKQDAEG